MASQNAKLNESVSTSSDPDSNEENYDTFVVNKKSGRKVTFASSPKPDLRSVSTQTDELNAKAGSPTMVCFSSPKELDEFFEKCTHKFETSPIVQQGADVEKVDVKISEETQAAPATASHCTQISPIETKESLVAASHDVQVSPDIVLKESPAKASHAVQVLPNVVPKESPAKASHGIQVSPNVVPKESNQMPEKVYRSSAFNGMVIPSKAQEPKHFYVSPRKESKIRSKSLASSIADDEEEHVHGPKGIKCTLCKSSSEKVNNTKRKLKFEIQEKKNDAGESSA